MASISVILNVAMPLKPRTTSARAKVLVMGPSCKCYRSKGHPADEVGHTDGRHSTLDRNARRHNG
jgi:hypothetical protein